MSESIVTKIGFCLQARGAVLWNKSVDQFFKTKQANQLFQNTPTPFTPIKLLFD